MEEALEKVHHGRNVRTARHWKRIKQTYLAKELGLEQSQISALENKERIEKRLLERIAKVLDVDLRFLETFVPERIIKPFSIHNEYSSNILNDQAIENAIIENQNNGLSYSDIKEIIFELKGLYKEVANLRILLAQNNIPYEDTK